MAFDFWLCGTSGGLTHEEPVAKSSHGFPRTCGDWVRTIINGHRHWRVAKAIGIDTVSSTIVHYDDDLDGREEVRCKTGGIEEVSDEDSDRERLDRTLSCDIL